MQFDAPIARLSGRLPGSPWETVCNCVHFEGVTATFHKTSPFLFFAHFMDRRRGSAPCSLAPSVPVSLHFDGVIP